MLVTKLPKLVTKLPPAPCLHSWIRTIGGCDATTPKPLRAGAQDVAYLEAVEGAFGGDIDYAMLVKLYGESSDAEKRYSPAVCIGARKAVVEGDPDPNHISTSFAERQNLNVRMLHTRRFTRLTNAFSKKVENHAHAVALFALYYNFVRVHKTLRMTPAMAAGVTKRLWEIADMDVLEAWENTT
jgi:hypothetical protein